MRVILEVTKSENEDMIGARFVFERHEAFVVGRRKNEKVQFRIPRDRYFSRYHFMIEISPPNCFLRDLGSTNGTRVNGEKVREAHLKDGDTVYGGHTEMQVRIESSESASADAPVAPEPAEPPAPTEPKKVDMVTDPFLKGRSKRALNALRCGFCEKLAEDTKIDDLIDTRIIAYVCGDCREKQRATDRPIPNYEKLDDLGGGELGPVYKARRISTNIVVTLKTIGPEMVASPQAAKLFLRQMQLAARLKHEHIVPFVEMGQAGEDLWIATEFIDGVDAKGLAERLGGTIPIPDAVTIVCQTLDALEYAHRRNLVHRDVKPSNILVEGQPGSYVAKLADFGLLRNMDEAGVSGITREGEARGTVPFMPPEQVLDCRFVKPAGDIYAAAATLYWLLSGKYVYDFDARDRRGELVDPFLLILDEKHNTTPIREHVAMIPEAVAQVIETALAYEPEDRFQTAVEMNSALERAIN